MSEHRYWAPPQGGDGRVQVGPGIALDPRGSLWAATVWAGAEALLTTNLLRFEVGGMRLVFDSHESDHIADHLAAAPLEAAHEALRERAFEDLGLPPLYLVSSDKIDGAPLTTARAVARIDGPQARMLAILLTEAPPQGRRLAWFVDAAPDTAPARLAEITRTTAAALRPMTDHAHV
jgi:hypothetical protein